ncbi:MAG: hypothetical protein CVV27_04545 [Candidatus Melainabacteria bacterium HGW-Melainabacteria-1]|nr:MAG: hypothetical protein CVV27_04545 [Candidatus Melainabacteria bacterium HGW-Melainabacteria-1]
MQSDNLGESLILIVDDQPQNLQMLSTTLREAGYHVAAANSGEAALRIFDRRLPALVLCDVVMPEMDGYEVCRRLKALPQGRDIPLVFLTARTDSQAILQGFECGAVDYVTKPFNTGELLSRVRTQIELRQARQLILDYARRMEALARHQDELLRQTSTELKDSLTAVLEQLSELEARSISLSPAETKAALQLVQGRIRQVLDRIESLLSQEHKPHVAENLVLES